MSKCWERHTCSHFRSHADWLVPNVPGRYCLNSAYYDFGAGKEGVRVVAGLQTKLSMFRRLYSGMPTKTKSPGDPSTGFAGFVQGVHKASDWISKAIETEKECRHMLDDVILSEPGPDVVRALDAVSDRLCQTIDAAEFCRNVHSDEEWRNYANQACAHLGGFVHELNTHYGLYTALDRALQTMGTDSSGANFSPECKLVGEMLRRDFQRFGVHLEGEKKERMTELIGEIQLVGHAYMQNAVDPQKIGSLVIEPPLAEACANVLNSGVRAIFKKSSIDGGSLVAKGDPQTCNGLLWHCDVEEIRKEAFRVHQQYPKENAALLHNLIQNRSEIASIMGYDSYSAYQLDGFSLSNTPHSVLEFLKSTQRILAPAVERDAVRLGQAKDKWNINCLNYSERQDIDSSPCEPWDRDWALAKLVPDSISARLNTLGTIFTVPGFLIGINALLQEVMGIKITYHSDLGPEETWADKVMKVHVEDIASGEFLGTVYLDLFRRPHKFGGAALFTLRCGRKIDEETYQVGFSWICYCLSVIFSQTNCLLST